MTIARPAERRRGGLRALLAADAVSGSGNAITWLAIPWFVHEATGSAATAGVAAAVGVAARALGGFAGGPLADRIDPRRLSIASDLCGAAAVAAIPVLHAADVLSWPVLLAVVLLGGLGTAPGAVARESLVPDLARAAAMPLARASGLVHSVRSSGEVFGPMIAGLLLATIDASLVLYVDAATFLFSALVFALFVPRRARAVSHSGRGASLTVGLRCMWRDDVLRTVTLGNAVTGLIGSPLFTVLMVVYVTTHAGGPAALGPIVAAGAVGLLLGAGAFSVWGPRLARRRWYLLGFAAFGLQYWFVALVPPLAVVLAVFFVRGAVTGVYNPLVDTVVLERAPAQVRGSVLGAISATIVATDAAGLLLGGVLVDAFGLSTTLFAMGAASALATLLLCLARAPHRMEPPLATEGPSAG